MKIKRFFAQDIRQALRQVREVLGPDAVILSNKSVEGGIELVAAMDYDESAFTSPSSSVEPTSIPLHRQQQSRQSETAVDSSEQAQSDLLNRSSGARTRCWLRCARR